MIWKRSEPDREAPDTVGAADTGATEEPGTAEPPIDPGSLRRPAGDVVSRPPVNPRTSGLPADASSAPPLPPLPDGATPGSSDLRFVAGPEDETIPEAKVFGPEGRRGSSDTVGEFDTATPSWDDDPTQLWREGSVIAGRYRITGFLGQGGMGKVYVAEDEILRRPIALKRVPQEILYDLDARDDLRQEANRLLDLAHENIVRVHTYFDGPTWPFFAMECLRGPTLKQLLRERRQSSRTFSPDEVLAIAKQVGRGLAHAHSHNIVHRDLKPANLMLAEPPRGEEITEADLVKITDFGISRAVADSTLRQTGRRSGTLPYMSPEQFLGEPSTVQSDIYSFGCTLYELLTGRTPFHTGDIGYQILKVDPRPLPRQAVPRAMANAILRALAKRPADRFATVEDFVAALETGARPPPRLARRRAIVALIIAAGLVSLLGWAMSGFGGYRKTEEQPIVRRADPSAATTAGVHPIEARFLRSELDSFREQLRRELESALGRPLGLEPGSVVVDGEPYRDFQLRFPEGPSGLSPELLSILEFCFYRVDPQVGVTDLDLQKMKFVRGADGDGERIFVLSNLTHGTYRLQAYLNDARSGPASRWYPLLGSTFQFVVDLRPPRFRVVFANEQIVDHPDRTAATFDEDVGFALVPDPDFVGDIAKAFVRDVTRDARASKAASGSSVAIPSAESSPPVFEILDPSKGRIPLPRAGRDYQFEVWALDAAGNESERKLVEIRRNRLEMNLGVGEVRGRTAEITGTLRYEGDDRACPALEFWVNGNPAAVAPGGELRFLDRVRTNDGLDSSMPFSVKLLLPSIENTIEARYRSKESASRSFAKKAIIEGVAIPVPEIVLEEPISSTTRQRTVRFAGRVRPYFHGLEFRIEHHGKLARQIELRMMGDEATFDESVLLLQDKVNVVDLRPYYHNSVILGPGAPSFTIRHDETEPACVGVELLERRSTSILVEVKVTEPLSLLSARIVASPMDNPEYYDLHPPSSSQEWTATSYQMDLPFTYSPGCSLELKMRDLAGNIATARRPLFSERGTQGTKPSVEPTVAATTKPRVQRSDFLRDLNLWFVSFGSPDEGLEMMRTEVPAEAWSRFLREERGENVTFVDGRKPMTIGNRPVSLIQDFVRWFEKRSDDGYEYFVPTVEQWLTAFVDADSAEVARQRIDDWFTKEFRISLPPRELRYGENQSFPIGSRKMVETPGTGLLDMEANVQEIVRAAPGETVYVVIGGSNHHSSVEGLRNACLYHRTFDPDRQEIQGDRTGLRLCRRPARAR